MNFVFWTLAIIQSRWIYLGQCYYHERSSQVFRPPTKLRDDAFFGYSIAYERQSRRLIVSAPRADTVGHVYNCNIDDQTCKKIDIINSTLVRRTDTKGYDYSNHDIWLGATVKSGPHFYVVCAPRFVEVNREPPAKERRFSQFSTFARCYSAPNAMTDPTMMTQVKMKDMNKGATVFENVTDSFGWSIEIDNHNTLVGSPAMSAGRVMMYLNPKATPSLTNGHTQTSDIVRFNFGYSIVSGNFFGSLTTYGISSPYGDIGKGKILFFTMRKGNLDLKRGKTIVHQHLGSLFGAALCSAKLSSTKKSDLLVGAPAYVSHLNLSYDVGAVYIYSSHLPNQLILNQTLYGGKEGGRFGSAIANAGDLDGDNKDDIVIAAPYEDEGRGAVYLYSGADLVEGKSYLQRIAGKEHRSFGLSLTALQDYDENGCNELAVGAPGSDTVMLLRCIASITVKVFENYGNLQNRVNKDFFVFKSCVDVTYPDKPKEIYANLSMKVNLMHANAVFKDLPLADTMTYTQIISRTTSGDALCKDITILTPEGDYTKLIGFTISASLEDSPIDRDKFEARRVTVSSSSVMQKSGSIWAADCKGSGKCNPVLSLEVTTTLPQAYLIGSTNEESVKVAMRNTGDTAYCACVKIRTVGVRVLQAPNMCKRSGDLLTCKSSAPIKLYSETEVNIETKTLTSEDKKIDIFVDMFKCCQDANPVQRYNKTINLISDAAGVVIKGSTNLGDVVKLIKSDDAGKNLNHIYAITNNGVTNWVGLRSEVIAQKQPHVNYVSVTTYKEELGGSITCDFKEHDTLNDVLATSCDIGNLAVNKTMFVHVSIFVSHEILGNECTRTKNATLQTKFKLFLGDKERTEEVTTTVMLLEATIPIWIIIVASLVGLVILVLIAVALYETGFLRRKNKQKLQDLRRSVKRQSMRRSMIRDGVRVLPDDRRTLMELSKETIEEETGAENTDTGNGKEVDNCTTRDHNKGKIEK